MAPPRASRLVTKNNRKSESDSLFQSLDSITSTSDNDDDPPTIPTTTKLLPPTTTSSKRRSSRLSHEDSSISSTSSTTTTTTTTTRPPSTTSTNNKSKRQKLNPPSPTQPDPSSSRSKPLPIPQSTGYIPRAAPPTTKSFIPPPIQSHSLQDEDSESFPFSTNPPTPHHNGKGKEVAINGTGGGGKKRPMTSTEDSEDSEETRSNKVPKTTTPPSSHSRDSTNPISYAETPIQMRNVAFRAGTSSAARRVSGGSAGRGSVKRASSLGGGFGGVPHRDVPNNKLYKSTNEDDPIAIRIRNVISWTSKRRRETLFDSPNEDPFASKQGGAGGEEEEIKSMAKEVLDKFIEELGEGKVDTSVRLDTISSTKGLPPHPQNLVNESKMKELQENYSSIASEQTSRSTLQTLYSSLLQFQPVPPVFDSKSISFPSITNANGKGIPKSFDEALDLGRKILAGEGLDLDEEGEDEMGEVERMVGEVRIQTGNFRKLTHRHSSFATISSSYIQSRIEQSHHRLSQNQSSASTSNLRNEDGIRGILSGTSLVRDDDENVVRDDGGRDLLRAISGAARGRG